MLRSRFSSELKVVLDVQVTFLSVVAGKLAALCDWLELGHKWQPGCEQAERIIKHWIHRCLKL